MRSNPNQNNGEDYFYVGTSSSTPVESQRYIKFTSNGSLEVKGSITATSGTFTGTIYAGYGDIAGWSISPNLLQKVEPGSFNIGLSTDPNEACAIWAGNRGNTTDMQFYVKKAGELHAEGAVISGNITATSGNIGGFTVTDKELYRGSGTGRATIGWNENDTTWYGIWMGNETANKCSMGMLTDGANHIMYCTRLIFVIYKEEDDGNGNTVVNRYTKELDTDALLTAYAKS